MTDYQRQVRMETRLIGCAGCLVGVLWLLWAALIVALVASGIRWLVLHG